MAMVTDHFIKIPPAAHLKKRDFLRKIVLDHMAWSLVTDVVKEQTILRELLALELSVAHIRNDQFAFHNDNNGLCNNVFTVIIPKTPTLKDDMCPECLRIYKDRNILKE